MPRAGRIAGPLQLQQYSPGIHDRAVVLMPLDVLKHRGIAELEGEEASITSELVKEPGDSADVASEAIAVSDA
jgi:hypothetical protein